MQIHELTQPKKTKLDEVDIVGPDSIFSKMLNPNAQNRYNSSAAKSMASLQKSGDLGPPTLDSALAKLKANPAAMQWIDGIVAKWPAAANQSDANDINEAVTRPSVTLDPKDPAQAALLAKYGDPRFQTPTAPAAQDPKQVLGRNIKSWINSQLRTTNIETVEQVSGVKPKLENLLNQMVSLQGNIPAQQKVLHDALSLITAANHVLSAQERTGARGPTAGGYRTAGSQTGETPAMKLSPLALENLKTLARGIPRPAKTNSDFLNALVDQVWG
jgi:hypothetical protein